MNKLTEPNKNCSKCKRLYNFRKENKSINPEWFNAPVPSFGDFSSSLLIVGLAPGLQGANKTEDLSLEIMQGIYFIKLYINLAYQMENIREVLMIILDWKIVLLQMQ